ncbi:MAG: MraY family glycosyltransferase [Woeseiaceae bacterium]
MASLARKLPLLDIPNRRSSHSTPTPRGGGLAIVIVASICFMFLAGIGVLNSDLTVCLLLGGICIAFVGLLDDIFGVPAWMRLFVHFGIAILTLVLLDLAPAILIGHQTLELSGPWRAISILAIVWSINLFNFMDGIDGIAAVEAIFITLSMSALASYLGLSRQFVVATIAVTAASTGFLVWNWPPAKLFMGDVGSGYLGYLVAVFGLSAGSESSIAIPVWLIISAWFLADATVTLVRRIARMERIFEAHRSHAYQKLARKLGSHARVTCGLTVLNVVFLLPAAAWAIAHPPQATLVALLVLIGASALVWSFGAGKRGEGSQHV